MSRNPRKNVTDEPLPELYPRPRSPEALVVEGIIANHHARVTKQEQEKRLEKPVGDERAGIVESVLDAWLLSTFEKKQKHSPSVDECGAAAVVGVEECPQSLACENGDCGSDTQGNDDNNNNNNNSPSVDEFEASVVDVECPQSLACEEAGDTGSDTQGNDDDDNDDDKKQEAKGITQRLFEVAQSAKQKLVKVVQTAQETPLGKALFFLYALYELFGVSVDIITDIVFYVDFHRTFKPWQQPALEATLLASLLLPPVIMSHALIGRFLGNTLTSHICNLFLMVLIAPWAAFFMLATDCILAKMILDDSDFELDMALGITLEQLRAVRGIVYATIEDIPQLCVQTWVFVAPNGGKQAEEFSTTTLVVSFLFTALNILCQACYLWGQASRFRGTGLSFLRYLAFLFGFVKGDKRIAEAYARLIREGKYFSTSLIVNSCSMDDDGCVELMAAIESHYHGAAETTKRIRCISFRDNVIGDRGVTRIADLIENGILPLRIMTLTFNRIGDEGARRLAEAIASEECVLKTVMLRKNPLITNVGYDALYEGMMVNESILELFVSPGEALNRLKECERVETTSPDPTSMFDHLQALWSGDLWSSSSLGDWSGDLCSLSSSEDWSGVLCSSSSSEDRLGDLWS